MALYYREQRAGKTERVVAQDATGVYLGARVGGGIRVVPYVSGRVPVTDRETGAIRWVSATTREYLDYMRRWHRHPAYHDTVPSEISELPGSAEEVIRQVLASKVD